MAGVLAGTRTGAVSSEFVSPALWLLCEQLSRAISLSCFPEQAVKAAGAGATNVGVGSDMWDTFLNTGIFIQS